MEPRIMEPHIIDYYNEIPHGVNIIDKLDEEYEAAQTRIKQLEKLLQKEKHKTEKMTAFTRPPCIDDDQSNVDEYEDKIKGYIYELCNGDVDDYEELSIKLLDDYKDYPISSNEDSFIKYMIITLNECTHYQNPRWCELFVLSTLEAHGINNITPVNSWEPPYLIIENLLNSLTEYTLPLLSLGQFEG